MPKLTLNRVFALSLAGLLAGLVLLFWLIFHGLQVALLRSAERARDHDSDAIADSVSDYLSHAPGAVSKFEGLLAAGLVRPTEPASLRDALLGLLIHNGDISEATFTSANATGLDAQGRRIFDPASVREVSLFRALNGTDIVHRFTWFRDGKYVASHFHILPNGQEVQVETPIYVPNPAIHPTFVAPTLPAFRGQILWTDLHWFSVDQAEAEGRRRVEVSVQKEIDYPPGKFAGVLRIGLFKGAIDRAIEKPLGVDTSMRSIFLCDNQGRLVALSGSNRYTVYGDDLRLSSTGAPLQVQAALQLPKLETVSKKNPVVSDAFVTSGTNFLCTFRVLPKTQDWIVGMAVPERVYLGDLLRIRRRVFFGAVILVAIITLLGGLILYTVSVAHSVILREAALMNDFVLSPSKNSCKFQDINRVLSSLERAKTAMRAMGKYVPMDLVRRLYSRDEEPCLGGETTELTVLFTDIKSFTEFAESRDPDTVAIHLGAYLEVLASVIQREKGTIDKFIGDSVMAFWNAPEPLQGYSALACRAALEGRAALELLYHSAAWEGMPGFETRFGLHQCVASVGHFGSPDRFNYTAIGDGINLASRLQSLNKHYGTTIMGSAALKKAAGPGFIWRHLDRVSVKGKTQGLDVYELLGEGNEPAPGWVAVYEEALEAYFKEDFQRAIALAESLPDDPPSVVLAARAQTYLSAPPPANWDGVYAFETK